MWWPIEALMCSMLSFIRYQHSKTTCHNCMQCYRSCVTQNVAVKTLYHTHASNKQAIVIARFLPRFLSHTGGRVAILKDTQPVSLYIHGTAEFRN